MKQKKLKKIATEIATLERQCEKGIDVAINEDKIT